MKNPQEYIAEAEFIHDLKVDIGFVIRNDFYYGDENDFTEEEWKSQRELLLKPREQLFDKIYLLSEDIEGNEQELADYYTSVLTIAKKHGKKLQAGHSYFWIRPLIYRKEIDTITFPWYDTLADALPFFNALQSTEEGCVFNDLDQGWHLVVYMQNEKIYFVFGSLEDPVPYWVVGSDRQAIAKMTKSVQKRIEVQIALLSQQTGYDFWTKAAS